MAVLTLLMRFIRLDALEPSAEATASASFRAVSLA